MEILEMVLRANSNEATKRLFRRLFDGTVATDSLADQIREEVSKRLADLAETHHQAIDSLQFAA